MNNEQVKSIEARLPMTLHRQLKKSAERNLRSVNSELIVAVRHYLTGAAPAAEPVAEITPAAAAQRDADRMNAAPPAAKTVAAQPQEA